MSSCPLSSHHLKNGLILLCLDQSKKIAVDYWYICVLVKTAIPVEKKWFVNNPINDEEFRQIKEVLGEAVVFQQTKKRNFIRADQKEQMIKDLCKHAVEMGIKYVGRFDFAAKYILKVFADEQDSRDR